MKVAKNVPFLHHIIIAINFFLISCFHFRIAVIYTNKSYTLLLNLRHTQRKFIVTSRPRIIFLCKFIILIRHVYQWMHPQLFDHVMVFGFVHVRLTWITRHDRTFAFNFPIILYRTLDVLLQYLKIHYFRGIFPLLMTFLCRITE